jgi:hypothetical protein
LVAFQIPLYTVIKPQLIIEVLNYNSIIVDAVRTNNNKNIFIIISPVILNSHTKNNLGKRRYSTFSNDNFNGYRSLQDSIRLGILREWKKDGGAKDINYSKHLHPSKLNDLSVRKKAVINNIALAEFIKKFVNYLKDDFLKEQEIDLAALDPIFLDYLYMNYVDDNEEMFLSIHLKVQEDCKRRYNDIFYDNSRTNRNKNF